MSVTIESIRSIEVIRSLIAEWGKEENGRAFGIEIDQAYMMQEMTQWIERPDSDVLVALEGDEPVGFLALFTTNSVVGNQLIAVEKYWYVCPSHRSCGTRLLAEAERWAKDRGCSHMIMSASKVAGGMFEKVCRFYNRMGFILLESSFLKEV